MWKAVETKARKIGIVKTKEGRWEKTRKERVKKERKEEEKTIEVKRLIEEWKTWEEEEEIVRLEEKARKLVLPVDSCLQEESNWENTNKKNIELYDRGEEKVCTKEEKDVFLVKKGNREDAQVY